MTIDKKAGFESWWGRSSKSVEWKQVVARQKTILNENNERKEESKMG